MKSNRVVRGLTMLMCLAAVCIVAGFVTMRLWNWLMPGLFGLHALTFAQALGLLVLSKILFGGIHRHAGGGRGWNRQMHRRWEQMSTEERERFRAGMRGRWSCGPRGAGDPVVEQTAL